MILSDADKQLQEEEIDSNDDHNNNNNNLTKSKYFLNAFKSDSLSNSVSELVIPSSINADETTSSKSSSCVDSLLVFIKNDDDDDDDMLPTLNLESGLLSPSSLLHEYYDHYHNATDKNEDGENDDYYHNMIIRKFLNTKETSNDDMRNACRNLQLAASQATIDMPKLIGHERLLVLTPRVELAFQLLTSHQENHNKNNDDDEYNFCHIYSSVQLLFAEMDYLLEAIAPEKNNNEDDNNNNTRAGKNWRTRDLMQNETIRSILGLPLSLILHLLAGPLNGVCLRNLIWHGYVGPIEVQYWSNLLWMIVALGMLPRCRSAVVTSSTINTYVPINDEVSAVVNPFDNYIPSDDAIMKLLEVSSPEFLPPYLHPILREAIRLCRRSSGLNDQTDNESTGNNSVGTHWRVLAMLYAILERGLRGLYVRENFTNSSDAVLLAHTNVLHITIATILRSTIDNDDKNSGNSNSDDSVEDIVSTPSVRRRTNMLFSYLCHGPVAALYDEFVWIGLPDASGPAGTPSTFSEHTHEDAILEPLPCRNELVHGALSLEAACIPWVMTRVVKLTIGLAAMTSTKNSFIENDPYIHRCQKWLEEYQPRRHPTLQLWRKFRDVCCRGGRNNNLEDLVQSHLPPFPPSPRRISPNDIIDSTPDDGLAVLHPMFVEYCPVCSLPYEYCCYTPSAVECLESRYCPATSTSLTSVMWLTRQVLTRLATTSSCVYEADANALSKELDAARRTLFPVVVSTPSGYETSIDDEVVDWSFLIESPTRRSSDENELAKLWMIRETALQCDNLIQRSYRWLLEVIARISCGETTVRMGKKKKPISMLVQRLFITLQACEVLLLMAMEQYHANAITSNVLSTFLSTVANTVATHLHERRLSLCLALAAGLIGQSDLFMSELPKSDRTKFFFSFHLYVDYAVHGTEPFNVHGMITHKYALGPSAYQKARSGADWGTLRRWQSLSE